MPALADADVAPTASVACRLCSGRRCRQAGEPGRRCRGGGGAPSVNIGVWPLYVDVGVIATSICGTLFSSILMAGRGDGR